MSPPEDAAVQRVAVIMNAAVEAASQSIHRALDRATGRGDVDTADRLIDLLRAVSAIDERAREQGFDVPTGILLDEAEEA